MAVPTDAHRQFAADLRAMHIALTDVGFTEDHAMAVLCQLVSGQLTPPARPDRRAQVERLLGGQKKPAERSPADDRASQLWNPPSPEGAPAHE